jgi:Domain of unknown function (DUF5122) beta-propeller
MESPEDDPMHTRKSFFLTVALLNGCFAALMHAPAQAIEPYGFDPSYSSNYIESLGPATTTAYGTAHGRRVALLPDGSSVVVGGIAFNGQPSPYGNVLMVRRAANGAAVTWPSNGATDLLYPGLATGDDSRIVGIHDVAYAAGNIFVLTTRRFFVSPVDDDVEVLIFDVDGNFVSKVVVFTSTTSERARDFHITSNTQQANSTVITVVAEIASPTESGRTLIGVAKIKQEASGLFARDFSFSDGVSPAGTVRIALSNSFCNAAAQPCSGTPISVDRPFRFPGGDGAPIYIAGASRFNGEDWDFLIVKLTPQGALDTSFSGSGIFTRSFDQPGSNFNDRATAIVASGVGVGQDYSTGSIWVVGNVSRSCAPGIGVAKFSATGTAETSFGSLLDGRGIYAGSAAPFCTDSAPDLAIDAAVQDGRLAIVGQGQFRDLNSTLRGDSLFLALDAQDGVDHSLTYLPYLLSATRVGDSALYGVVPSGNGKFALSGESLDNSNAFSFLSARLRPIDVLFRNGFEEPL